MFLVSRFRLSTATMSDPVVDGPPPSPLAISTTHVRRLCEIPSNQKLTDFYESWAQLVARPENIDTSSFTISDFCFGIPQDAPSPQFVKTIERSLVPKTANHYRYRTNEEHLCKSLAQSCAKRYGLKDLSYSDVFLTTGNFAAISLAIQLLVEPHENVVYMEPGWFFYHQMILHTHAHPNCVKMPLQNATDSPDEHLGDMTAFLNAIDDNTKLIILNSPHNPTGKVYSRSWLEKFSGHLLEISLARGRPIYVLADEAYSDYVFDGLTHESIASIYPYSLLAYTYNKMTLAPSQRVGYLILSPLMPGRENIRPHLSTLQMVNSWCFPNADMGESILSLEKMRDDFSYRRVIEKRVNRTIEILTDIGYELLMQPKGTFYMLVKTPIEDDQLFCDKLWEENVLVIPGVLFSTPGCFRLSMTATDRMVENSEKGFRKAFNSFQ